MRRIVLKNARVVTPNRIISNGGVIVEGEIIQLLFEGDQVKTYKSDKIINLKGRYLAPGFIDIHTHGAGGYDFMDGTIKSIKKAAKFHMQHGTTSIVPTILTCSEEELFKLLDLFRQVKDETKNVPNLLGLHLEGPYLSLEQRGAQDPKYIRKPDEKEYLKILDYSNEIIRWTIAPELKGAIKMGRELRKRNIVASIGHSNAIYKEVLSAFDNGFKHITHLYSGMSSVRRINAYRYSGVVESAYLVDEMTVEIIADGKHLPPSLLKLIYKIKGADKICLITDSMRAAGMPEGEYILGNQNCGQKVIVEEGVAKLMDKTAFAGSVATGDQLIRNMVKLADVSLKEAIKMITLTPARVIGVDSKKGSISAGKVADIVVFDNDIQIKMVMVKGNIEFTVL